LSNIKKLAGQTLWYGLSSIGARFIGYLLTPLLTYSKNVSIADFGKQGLIYAMIPVLNVLFTYGFETAYFRFASKEENKSSIYNTSFLSLLFSTILFTFLLWQNQEYLAAFTGLSNIPEIVQLSIFIIALDALNTIPFARLRQQEKPKKFAFTRVAGIVLNLVLVWFFVNYCHDVVVKNPHHPLRLIYDVNKNPIVYVMLANLIQSAFTLVLLSKEILEVRFKFNTQLWKEMMIYSLPLVVVGLGGIINETFDRLMLRAWIPGSDVYKDEQVGIYNACYKLSILITLFIQAFKMGAEPFFFKQAEGQNPQRTYARVMKFFVIVLSFMFLVVALYLPIWQYMVGEKYRVGLSVVPLLLLANIFLGIYYNLSIWYKLGNKTIAGTYITLIGSAITLLINYLFIPRFGYMASAWATFLCYGTMMVLSYAWGQKEYPIPYVWKKLVAYLVIVVLLYFIHKGAIWVWPNLYFSLAFATLLLLIYGRFLLLVEKTEFQKLPVIGKFIR
jgi:O-antigen/teichoic acid export membrane protein